MPVLAALFRWCHWPGQAGEGEAFQHCHLARPVGRQPDGALFRLAQQPDFFVGGFKVGQYGTIHVLTLLSGISWAKMGEKEGICGGGQGHKAA